MGRGELCGSGSGSAGSGERVGLWGSVRIRGPFCDSAGRRRLQATKRQAARALRPRRLVSELSSPPVSPPRPCCAFQALSTRAPRARRRRRQRTVCGPLVAPATDGADPRRWRARCRSRRRPRARGLIVRACACACGCMCVVVGRVGVLGRVRVRVCVGRVRCVRCARTCGP